MEYFIIIIFGVLGGSIVGWTSASNIDKSAWEKPRVFRKIDPLYFIGFGFSLPAIIGFRLAGLMGIVVALVITWLSSVVIGGSIHRKV